MRVWKILYLSFSLNGNVEYSVLGRVFLIERFFIQDFKYITPLSSDLQILWWKVWLYSYGSSLVCVTSWFSHAAFKIHSFRFWHFNYNVLVWISLAYLLIKSLGFLHPDICFFPQPREDSATIFLSKISLSSSVRSPTMQVLVCLRLSHKTLKLSWLFRFLFAALFGEFQC